MIIPKWKSPKQTLTTGEELEGAKLQILNKEGEILEEWVTDGKASSGRETSGRGRADSA